MKGTLQMLRFLLGGGWWTIWYALFYLIVLSGNFAWFGDLYDWSRTGQSGPAAEAVFIGLLSFGGIPLFFFTVIHLLLAVVRGTDHRRVKMVFTLVLVLLVLAWMVIGPMSIAGALFSGFILYYLALLAFIYVNLALLWVNRCRSSLHPLILFWL